MSKEIKISASCTFCSAELNTEFELPDGWAFKNEDLIIPEASLFCPDHAKAALFFEDQCPGCMRGWPECGLFSSYAHDGHLNTDESAMLKQGRCPFRINGTSTFTPGEGFEPLDLSKPNPEAGIAIDQAIRDYLKEYGQ